MPQFTVVKLTTHRPVLRPPELSDADSIARYANNRRVWLGLRDRMPHPYSLEDAREFIERSGKLDPPTVFAVTLDSEAIGMVGIEIQQDVFRHSGEVGYWLGEPFWKKGLATEAVERLTAYGFEDLGLARLYSQAFGSNPGSRRVLEKAGYHLEGTLKNGAVKDGQLLDVFLYAKLRD